MSKPWVIITGATGFLGGELLRQLRREFRIFALGRRSAQEAGCPEGEGIRWYRVDVADRERLEVVFRDIARWQPIDLLLHLAAYYDFTGEDHPEYTRTNVEGTRNVLELASTLPLRRFIYTSSVAACPFPPFGETIDESTAPTAPVPYARSKRAGEALMRSFSDRVPTCIVRPAAVISDWCEYEPLDVFLQTWCSRGWSSRILGGRGLSAIPYLHVEDLLSFYLRVVERADDLAPCETLQASPDGCTSHLELFRVATRARYGHERWSIRMPKPLARIGIAVRERLGRALGKIPFERSWMADYIDLQLRVDAERTRRRLDWAPNRDRGVIEMLPRLVSNLREHREEWMRRSRRRIERTLGPRELPDDPRPAG